MSKSNTSKGLAQVPSGMLHIGVDLSLERNVVVVLSERGDFPDIGGPQHYFDTPDDAFAIDFGIWAYKTSFEPTRTFTEADLRAGLVTYPNAWGLHGVLDPGDYQPNNAGPYAPDYFDQ